MRKRVFGMALLLLLLALLPAASAFENRDAMRAAYRSIAAFDENTPYERTPELSGSYDAGVLKDSALDEALDTLNFLRTLAGLKPVNRNLLYDFQCQHGATLMAVQDMVDHHLPQPENMDDDFYASALKATTSANIARFNWMRPSIVREAVTYFVRDDGEANLAELGHRRWLLNPKMAYTGFGLANSESGMSYVAMYAHDLGRSDARWDTVCWPTGGVFPVELMHKDLAWSVMLNAENYDLAHSRILVTLSEKTLGLTFRFRCSEEKGDGYCGVNAESYGAGPCVIFRPKLPESFTDYLQNQHWRVQVQGLAKWDGTLTELDYEVEMASLYAQDVVNVEMEPVTAEVPAGETLALSARVIPEYADDLSLTWRSSDERIAVVDGNGVVTGQLPGTCEITAESANGRSDTCALTVVEAPR